jgi:hypothetical protein
MTRPSSPTDFVNLPMEDIIGYLSREFEASVYVFLQQF